MSDWVMDLAEYANTNFSWLTLTADSTSHNLFVNDLPDQPDSAVCFYRYGGAAPTELFGNTFSARNPRLQVLVRDPFSEVANDYAEQIMKYVGSILEQSIGNTYFHKVTPVGELTELGPDTGKRQRTTVNFQVNIRGAG